LIDRGLVLDANLLVLLVVGSASRDYIGRHKRLQAYTVDDYETLASLVDEAQSVSTTPNALTEASNIASQIAEPARTHIRQTLAVAIGVLQERYIASSDACGKPEFIRVGLTDTVMLDAVGQREVLLTADLDLYLSALARQIEAVNFNHLRETERR
jgi:hypothetical protein